MKCYVIFVWSSSFCKGTDIKNEKKSCHKFKIFSFNQSDIFIIFALCRVIENAFRIKSRSSGGKKLFDNINIFLTAEKQENICNCKINIYK